MGRDFDYKIQNTKEKLEDNDDDIYGWDDYEEISWMSRHNSEICYDNIYSYDDLKAEVLALVLRGNSDEIWEAVRVFTTLLGEMYKESFVRIQYS
jgi:hypothetical protein